SRYRTGSTHGWRSRGRGLSPPVGSSTPPRKQAALEYRSPPDRRQDAPRWLHRAAIDGVAGPRLTFRERLHLGRYGNGLAVMSELPPIGARDPDRYRHQGDVLENALPVLDPDESAFEVLRLVELGTRLVETLADPLGDVLRRFGGEDRDEVVAAHVTDEPVGADVLDDGVRDDPGDCLDQPAATDEPLLVVVRLEIVQIAIQHGEGTGLPNLSLDLFLDPDVARQTGQRRKVPHLLRATERSLHAGQELDRIEGFDDVVVGPGLQARDLVCRQGLGGQHDDA